MKQRLVMFPVETILALFKDYMGMLGVPEDAKVDSLEMNPQEKKMMLIISAESYDGPQPAEQVRFDLQRTFLVN